RKPEKNRDSAQNRLKDDGPARGIGDVSGPGARLAPMKKKPQGEGEQGDGARDHAVPMLEEDAADHGREESAERERPVRDRQRRARRSDEAPGDEQEKSGGRG